MELTHEKKGDSLVITVHGKLDTLAAPEFDNGCSKLLEENEGGVILDFSTLEYISSSGLRSILVLSRKMKSSGRVLSLAGLKGLVQEVIKVSGFDSFLTIYDDVEGALKGGA